MLKSGKEKAIEEAFKKHSSPEERILLRNAFCLDKVTVQNSAEDYVIVEDAKSANKREIVITGCINLTSLEVDPKYFLTKVYDPNEAKILTDFK